MVEVDGAVWRGWAGLGGGGGGTAEGDAAVDWGVGGGGGPDEEAVSCPAAPLCGPDIPTDPLPPPRPTFAQPRAECWLLLAQDPVVDALLRLFRLEDSGDFLVA